MSDTRNAGAAAVVSAPAPATADDYVAAARRICARDGAVAARHLYEALRLDPDHPHAHSLLARYFYEVRMLPEALEHGRRAVQALPHDAEVALNHLLVLDALDMTAAAMELLALHLDSGTIHPDLVNLFARFAPRTKREAEALEQIEKTLLLQSLTPVQRKGLHMQAGWLLDRLGRYDEAFDHVRRGHAADPVPFEQFALRREVTAQAKWFSAERLRSLPKATHGWSQPLFIVGMPRSGTSLVEQILDAHPEVSGAGELVEMIRVVNEIDSRSQGTYPSFLARATPAQLDATAGLYLSRVASFAPNARYIADKQLFNWMYLGVISRLFPRAHVIHVVRDPLDTCLSCYMTQMNQNVTDTSDLRHLGIHYNDHLALMRHWREVLDLPILEVSYEQLVADPQAQITRVLEFLGLPWDERCLDFHQNTRAVITASMHQVRRPLYNSSVGRWKHYERHLGPLREGLKL